jgi:hypothetical protein
MARAERHKLKANDADGNASDSSEGGGEENDAHDSDSDKEAGDDEDDLTVRRSLPRIRSKRHH